jgi:HEAT repeat protein
MLHQGTARMSHVDRRQPSAEGRPRRAVSVVAALMVGYALLGSASCGTPSRSARPTGSGLTSSPSTVMPAPQVPAGRAPSVSSVDPNDPAAVARVREQALQLLVSAVRHGQPEERVNALEGLMPVPSRLSPLLREALLDASPAVRITAATLIGRLRLTEHRDALRPLLADASDSVAAREMVVASAVYALARLNVPVDLSPLGRMVKESGDARVRAQAAVYLGMLGNPSAIPVLRDAARTPMPRAEAAAVRLMQLQIAQALVMLGDADAIHELRAALYPSSESDLEATALSAQILGELQDRNSTNQLIILTAWNQRETGRLPAEVRLAAATALAKIGNRRGSFIADEYITSSDSRIRAQAAILYGETRQQANLARLEALMNDPERRVQIAAAAGILKITDGSITAAAVDR